MGCSTRYRRMETSFGVVGHRGCGALDVSKLAFAIDLGGAYDEESIQVTCEGLQIVHPISSIPSGDDRVGCKIDVNDRASGCA